MTKISIIFDDKTVSQDGIGYQVSDLGNAPDHIHALQWNGNAGWIEFLEDDMGNKAPNEILSALPDWISLLLSQWTTADEKYKSDLAAFQAQEQKVIAQNEAVAQQMIDDEARRKKEIAEQDAIIAAAKAAQNAQPTV